MVGCLMNFRRRLTTKVMLTGTAVVRNRMPGGVGGRREQSRLLPDPEDLAQALVMPGQLNPPGALADIEAVERVGAKGRA